MTARIYALGGHLQCIVYKSSSNEELLLVHKSEGVKVCVLEAYPKTYILSRNLGNGFFESYRPVDLVSKQNTAIITLDRLTTFVTDNDSQVAKSRGCKVDYKQISVCLYGLC